MSHPLDDSYEKYGSDKCRRDAQLTIDIFRWALTCWQKEKFSNEAINDKLDKLNIDMRGFNKNFNQKVEVAKSYYDRLYKPVSKDQMQLL